MKKLCLIFVAMVFAVMVTTPFACKPSGSPSTLPPAPAEVKQAEFQVLSLEVTPPEAIVGEAVTVITKVKNVGAAEGTYTATLTIDGVESETKSAMVAPGNVETVTFSLVKDKAGTYQIAVGDLKSSFRVNEIATILKDLKVAYPELFQELLKLPDLKEIDEKDSEAIEDIVRLALDSKYKTAFESMLNEGIKNKRKYCAPLQALFWIAYDGKINADHLLKAYSLNVLLHDAWTNTTTSDNYCSSRWQDFNEVIDRLNSPGLILQYAKDNISYDFESQERILKGEPAPWKTPSQTFNLKMGNCNDQGRFALSCLLQNGYTYNNFQGSNRSACCLRAYLTQEQPGVGHVSCLYKDSSDMFYILNLGHLDSAQNSIEGPFFNIEEAADATYAPWTRYYFFHLDQNITYGPILTKCKCQIDGSTEDWPYNIVMVADPAGDFSSDAKDKRGVDLKAVRAFMDEDYLYVAIQIYDVFEPSLLRNYFIALDFDNDGRDEYHFGVRPNGDTWVFDHTRDKNNWTAEDTRGVVVAGKQDTIEVKIRRKYYSIPRSILIYCRVTEGGPTIDATEWFKVP